MDRATLDAWLQSKEGQRRIDEMRDFAARRLQGYDRPDCLADDLVYEAVTKMLERATSLRDDRPLNVQLYFQVCTEVGNCIDRRHTEPFPDQEGWEPADDKYIQVDVQLDVEDRLKCLRHQLKDDPLALLVLEQMERDPFMKPDEMAEVLGFTVGEIYNALRRIGRAVRYCNDLLS
jgi:DNA-directed RNA polymerase specialized sigma24 family protein